MMILDSSKQGAVNRDRRNAVEVLDHNVRPPRRAVADDSLVVHRVEGMDVEDRVVFVSALDIDRRSPPGIWD